MGRGVQFWIPHDERCEHTGESSLKSYEGTRSPVLWGKWTETWNVEGSLWKSGNTLPCRWLSTDCLEKLWSFSQPSGHHFVIFGSGWPWLNREVGLNDLQTSFPSSAILGFCEVNEAIWNLRDFLASSFITQSFVIMQMFS